MDDSLMFVCVNDPFCGVIHILLRLHSLLYALIHTLYAWIPSHMYECPLQIKCINVPLICIYVPWNVQMSNHKCDSLMSYVPISILWQNLPVPALPFCSCHFCYIKLLVLFPYGSKVFPVMSKLYSVWPQYCLFCTQLCLLCQYCSQLHWYCSL